MFEQYENVCCQLVELLVVVLSSLPERGSLVRSYSKLENVHKKDRNHLGTKWIEGLCLRAIFQPNDEEELFESIRKVLSETSESFNKNKTVCNKSSTLMMQVACLAEY